MTLVALLVALAAAGSVPERSAAQQAALDPIRAANKLLADPWNGGLRQQYEFETERGIEESLEGKELAGGGGSVGISYRGVGVTARWSFGLTTKNVVASVDLAAPPGFRSASLDGFAVDAPLGGFWNFAFASDVDANASVRAAGNRIFSWSPNLFRLGFRISNFRFSAAAQLNAAQPDRPLLVRATLSPQLTIGGSGAIPVSIPVSFRSEIKKGRVSLSSRVTDLSIGLPGLDARLTGDIIVTLLPSQYVADLELDLRQEVLGVPAGDVINLSGAFQHALIQFRGNLSLGVRYVGRVSVPFSMRFPALLPSTDEINQTLQFLQPPLPKQWGEDRQAPAAPAPDTSGFAAAAEEIENAVIGHMPHGGVLSFDFDRLEPKPLTYTYGVGADSAIWTGHYLAAEAFRYAATQSPDALARVKYTLAGLKRLFDVTSDAAVVRGIRVPVAGGPGILSRTARPSDDPVDYTPGPPGQTTAGPLNSRPCYYMHPEGGWSAGGRTYASYGEIPLALRMSLISRTIQPVGTIWYGWGCGNNHPISRDQYVGVFMGLAYAYQLVPDPEARDMAKRLLEDALDFLLRNNWNVRLPPDNRIETNFMGDFPKQLAFLRIGKTINPAKYGARYDEVAAAAELTWIPVWFSAIDPLFQYYKFNLTHAAFGPALLLEADPATRARWMVGYRVLWRTIRHHRNAWFDLLRVLVHEPGQRPAVAGAPTNPNASVSLSDEVKALLGEWLRRRAATLGPNRLPLNRIADSAPQLALWPNDIGRFQTVEGTQRCLARYPLPLHGRVGRGMDFAWQRDPFALIVDDAGCNPSTPPSQSQFDAHGGDHRLREGPAVDFLLAYWLGVYLGVVPGPAAPMPSTTPPPMMSDPAPPTTGASELAAGRLATSPRRPRQGRIFTANVRVSNGGRAVPAAKVRCAARIGRRVLPLQSKRFRRSVATCAWRVPPRTGGRKLAGSVAVQIERATLVRRFSVGIR